MLGQEMLASASGNWRACGQLRTSSGEPEVLVSYFVPERVQNSACAEQRRRQRKAGEAAKAAEAAGRRHPCNCARADNSLVLVPAQRHATPFALAPAWHDDNLSF